MFHGRSRLLLKSESGKLNLLRSRTLRQCGYVLLHKRLEGFGIDIAHEIERELTRIGKLLMNYIKNALTVGILNCSYIHGIITRRYVSVHLESLAKLVFGICLLILQCTV